MIQQALRENQPLPDRIKNAPELGLGSYFYLQAFLDLDSERQTGMSMGQIPNSKIREYARWAEASDIVEFSLLHHIRVMDADHIKRTNAKADKGNKDNGKKFNGPRKKVR